MPRAVTGDEAASHHSMAKNQAAQMSLAKSYLVAAFSFMAAAAAQAQTIVAGQVIDRQKRAPLTQLTVELLSVRDSVLHTAVTANDGTFALFAPSGGVYRVRFVADGAPTHVSDTVVVAEGEYAAREFPLDMSERPLTEKQVDKPVIPAPGSPAPRYPQDLRASSISGCVLVQFIVDTTGRADRGTLRLLAYTHREFVEAVWDALPKMRFTPAEIRGRKVRQIVQQPFNFTIQGDQKVECKPPAKK